MQNSTEKLVHFQIKVKKDMLFSISDLKMDRSGEIGKILRRNLPILYYLMGKSLRLKFHIQHHNLHHLQLVSY